MGIPGFYGRWLTEYVASAILNGLPTDSNGQTLRVSSLSFDLNGAIHEARKQIYGDVNTTALVKESIIKTDPHQLALRFNNVLATIVMNAVQHYKPQDTLILAVDGVAPGGKLQQQKARRERSAKNSFGEVFDRNAITPGTDFMISLDNFIKEFIGRFRNDLPPKVIYSSFRV